MRWNVTYNNTPCMRKATHTQTYFLTKMAMCCSSASLTATYFVLLALFQVFYFNSMAYRSL